MRLLVTGASGFIGRNLLRAIPEHWLVTATYNRSADFPAFIERLGRATIVPFQVDLTESDAATRLKSSQGAFDACVFLAANGDPALSVAKPAFDLRSNTISCVQLLEALHFERLIYFSSGAVYDGMVGAVSRDHISLLFCRTVSRNSPASNIYGTSGGKGGSGICSSFASSAHTDHGKPNGRSTGALSAGLRSSEIPGLRFVAMAGISSMRCISMTPFAPFSSSSPLPGKVKWSIALRGTRFR